jgi:hypothetical protein
LPSDYQLPLYGLALIHGVEAVQGMPSRLSFVNLEGIEKLKKGGFSASSCRTVLIDESGGLDYKKGRLPAAMLTDDVARGIGATLARMSASPYPARPGHHCNWCSFRSACERRQGEATP